MSAVLDRFKDTASKIAGALRAFPERFRGFAGKLRAHEPRKGGVGGISSPKPDLSPLLSSKPFLAVSASIGLVALISLTVAILLSRPLPKGRERLPALVSLDSLEGFKLPDFPERFETVELWRDPKAPPDPEELASFHYPSEPGSADAARKLAREAVEAFYEGIE